MAVSNHNLQRHSTGQQQQLSELHSPLRYVTLKHFLDASLNTQANIEEIASAVEFDPIILASFLRLHDHEIESIENWFDLIDPSLFPAMAVTMSSDFLNLSLPVGDTVTNDDLWYQSLLHSLIAEEIIKHHDSELTAQARLAGLLANLAQMMSIVSQSTHSPESIFNATTNDAHQITDQQTADMLRSWGCKPAFCDAIRYQHAELEYLADTDPLIKTIAISGYLLTYVDKPDSFPVETIETANKLGFSGKHLSDSLRLAKRKLDEFLPAETDFTIVNKELKQAVDDAAIKAIFQLSLSNAENNDSQRLTRDAGKFLFSFNNNIRILPRSSTLEANVAEDEVIRIPVNSEESLVARCYREGQLQTILPENANSIQDKQLLDRSGHEVLLCIPMMEDYGVLACGINRDAIELSERRPQLLLWYTDVLTNYMHQNEHKDRSLQSPQIEKHLYDRINKLIHEANNPFAVIQNYLHTLSVKLGDDSPLQKEIDIISSEITRTSNIISSFKDIDPENEANISDTNVNVIVDELISVFKGSNNNIRFYTDLDDAIPLVSIRVDDIKQILINLIKNAVECFDDNQSGNKEEIVISTNAGVNINGNHYLEIVISDNGPGITEEIQKQLFQPNLSTKGAEHSGLGLSIVMDLVNRIEAMISCKTSNKKDSASGTTFSILIPQDTKIN